MAMISKVTPKIYKAALIGCGRIGSEFANDPRAKGILSHAQAYALCPDTSLVAVCDVSPEKARACAEQWDAPAAYTDIGDLFAEQRPEIVSICTPDSTHYEMALATLAVPSVQAILLEKPIALALQEGQEIVNLAKQRGVILAVNYSRRYTDSHSQLREFIQAGGLGQIQVISGGYTKGVLHNGTHWFDLVRWLVGEVSVVQGFNALCDINEDATLDVRLQFSCGASGYLHGYDDRYYSVFDCDLWGTKQRVRLTDMGNTFETYHVADSPYYSGYRTLIRAEGLVGGMNNPMKNAVADLVDCIKKGRKPRCSGEDALASLRIALAARTSAASGREVRLNEVV